MGMATPDGRAEKVDEIHARVTEARVAIAKALACNSRTPSLAGSHDVHRALTEAERLLNNVSAALPWRFSTT